MIVNVCVNAGATCRWIDA